MMALSVAFNLNPGIEGVDTKRIGWGWETFQAYPLSALSLYPFH